MEITRTLKARIVLNNNCDYSKLMDTMIAFRNGCNTVSEYIFNNNFPLNQLTIQKEIYQDIRSKHQLKSQMSISTIRTVVARYKTVQTQLRKQSVWDGYKKDNHGKPVRNYIRKDLDFLWKPIAFNRPQLDLVRNRDYTIKDDHSVTLNTIQGRVAGRLVFNGLEQYLQSNWRFGTAKIVKSGKHYYMHISVTTDIPEFQLETVGNVVGIDRGLRQIVTTYDNKGLTQFVNGRFIKQKRNHYKHLRASLQAKGTQSAKRRLRKLAERESRWMNDVNHCLSKTLVKQYGKHTLFVLEDLTNVTFDTVSKRKKENRYEHHSWSFYDLEQKLAYKAIQNESQVITVSAQYTSQRCPKCGIIRKENRDKDNHIYHCYNCNYTSNDDRVAAMNIYELGKWFVSGVEKPQFEIIENEKW